VIDAVHAKNRHDIFYDHRTQELNSIKVNQTQANESGDSRKRKAFEKDGIFLRGLTKKAPLRQGDAEEERMGPLLEKTDSCQESGSG